MCSTKQTNFSSFIIIIKNNLSIENKMSNYQITYSERDAKIDKYLGTNNLRPGPKRRLVNYPVKFDENHLNKQKDEKRLINFNAYSMKNEKSIKWGE
jgi:hypothetical protein